MAGNTAPLPVKGSVSLVGETAIEVVVVAMVLPCVTTVAGRVVDDAITLVGTTSVDVVGELDVVLAAVVVDPWIPDTAVVVGAIVVEVVVDEVVVDVVDAVVVVGQ